MFVAPRRVEIVDSPLPVLTNGKVLVQTLWSGISSGTELLAYRGEIDPELPLDESIGVLAGTFSFRSSTATAASVGSIGSWSDIPEGRIVFALHANQDRFVVGTGETIDVDGVRPAGGDDVPLSRPHRRSRSTSEASEETVALIGVGQWASGPG